MRSLATAPVGVLMSASCGEGSLEPGTGAARVAAAVDRRCRGDVFGVRRTAAAGDRTRIRRLRSGRHICVGAGLADAISRATRSEPDLFVGPTGSGSAFNRVTVDLLVADGVSIGRLADLVDDPSMLFVLEIAEIVAGSRRVRVAR